MPVIALSVLLVLGTISFEVWRRSEAVKESTRLAMLREEASLTVGSLHSRVQNFETCLTTVGNLEALREDFGLVTLELGAADQRARDLTRVRAKLVMGGFEIPFLAWTSGEKVVSCFGENSAGSLCSDLGGILRADGKCEQTLSSERLVGGQWLPNGTCRVVVGKCEEPFVTQDANKKLLPNLTRASLCMECD